MKPSTINLNTYSGYFVNVPDGWVNLPAATIVGDGYTVEFSRLSERTIDPMCDARNGWYNVWTKFCCEYTDGKGKLSIVVRKPEDADKLYDLLSGITADERDVFSYDDAVSAVAKARICMETMINHIIG